MKLHAKVTNRALPGEWAEVTDAAFARPCPTCSTTERRLCTAMADGKAVDVEGYVHLARTEAPDAG